MARAAVVLVKDGSVALIRRQRQDQTYYLFPGGSVESGESPEQAASREALEELGLEITVRRLIATVEFNGRAQQYYDAQETGGDFGSGKGPGYHPT